MAAVCQLIPIFQCYHHPLQQHCLDLLKCGNAKLMLDEM